MPVKRRLPKTRMQGLSDVAYDLLTRGEASPDPESPGEQWDTFMLGWCSGSDLAAGQHSLESLWRQHGEAVLADWIEQHPGTRPAAWWAWSGPDAQPGEPMKLLPTPPPLADQRAILARVGALTTAERRTMSQV